MHESESAMIRDRRSPHPPSQERGAALAVSLLILIVLTLLGIAAMRSSRIELKLSQNTESRVSSLQMAQAIADNVTQKDSFLSISNGPGYIGCYTPPDSSKQPDAWRKATLDQDR